MTQTSNVMQVYSLTKLKVSHATELNIGCVPNHKYDFLVIQIFDPMILRRPMVCSSLN